MSLEQLRNDVISIFEASLEAVNPVNAVKNKLKRAGDILELKDRVYNLKDYENIYVIGMGKAAAAMGSAIEDILGADLTAGVVNVKYGHVVPLKTIKVNEAGHPVPDESGLRGTRQIVGLLEQTTENDLVICLISGGGSALLPLPAGELTLENKQELTKALLSCGATIHEINALRKQISGVKGGRLAKLAYPSTVISLILSDVIGDDLDVIASGPTVPDTHTFHDCLSIIDKYKLGREEHGAVIEYIKRGCSGEIDETPKADDPVFERTQNTIIASNISAAKAAQQKARELGYNSMILSTFIHGETEEVAKVHTAIAEEIIASGDPLEKPACIITGGETTVTIQGTGKGGRNQEFALSSAIYLKGIEGAVILSGGTDGTDGPTEAAGAVADGSTCARAERLWAWTHSSTFLTTILIISSNPWETS